MALDFPNSPSVDDIHNENGIRFQWDGQAWVRIVSAGNQGFQGHQGVQGSAGGAQGFQGDTGGAIASSSAPASATSAGTAGTIAFDADFMYVCIATNTWKRVAISTWS